MEIQFKLTEEDYILANRFFMLDVLQTRKYKKLLGIIGIISIAMFVVQVITKGLLSNFSVTFLSLMLGGIGIFFILLYPDYFAKKTIRNVNNKWYLEQVKYTIRDETITVERQAGSADFKFEGIISVNENVDLFMFRTSSNQMIMFPKKYLTAEQESELHQISLNFFEGKYYKY